QWVEPNGCFECVADLEGEAETGYRSGAVGLHAVCTAGPVLCRAVVGERAKRGGALGGCGRGQRLRVVCAAEQQVRLTVGRIRGEDLLQLGDGSVGVAI